MAKTYYGPGSTGATPTYDQAPQLDAFGNTWTPLGYGKPVGMVGMDQSGRPIYAQATGLPGSQGGMGDGDAKLEEQRQLAFGSLAQGANIFAGGLGQQAESNLLAQMRGQDAPYTQAVQDRLFSSAASGIGGAAERNARMIRQQMSNRGMSGSGASLALQLENARSQQRQLGQAQADIQNRAQLENFAARERGVQGATQFMTNRAASEAPFRLKEADLRSRFEVTGQSPMAGYGYGGLGGTGVFSTRAVGGGGQMGFQMGSAGGVGGTGFGFQEQPAIRGPNQPHAGVAGAGQQISNAMLGALGLGLGGINLSPQGPVTQGAGYSFVGNGATPMQAPQAGAYTQQAGGWAGAAPTQHWQTRATPW